MNTTLRTIESSLSPEDVVEDGLSRVKSLSTLPEVAMAIIEAVDSKDSTAADIECITRNDPVLSANILKVVNSAFYGLPRQIASIKEAIVLVGLKVVSNIAVVGSIQKHFQNDKSRQVFDLAELWKHSVAVAVAARSLATSSGYSDPEQAFLAGLIHDLGIIAEWQACSESTSEVVTALSTDPDLSFREAESQILGATHEDFGVGISRKWGFPDSLTAVTGFHHRPIDAPPEYQSLTALVHVADILAAKSGIGYTRTVETAEISQQALSLASIRQCDIDELEQSLAELVEKAELGLTSDT